jgi:hypothetical protein
MVAGLRPRIALGSAAGLLAVTAVAAYAAGQVATISKTSATPKRFCVKRSDTCGHPGTTIRFTISTPAKVYGDVHSRKANCCGFVAFTRRFPAGANSIRLNDSRLTPGRWTLKLMALNSVAASSPANIDLRVVKSAP